MPFVKGQKSHSFIDLQGRRFEKLKVISREENSEDGRAMWLCLCNCGNNTIVKGKYLLNGDTKSCGCFNIEKTIERNMLNTSQKGLSTSRIYRIWHNMISRCEKGFGDDYKYYKSKGIKVCEEWHNFIIFREWALANGYDDKLQIDRINFTGNYEPTNCRWVTPLIQANNRSNSKQKGLPT